MPHEPRGSQLGNLFQSSRFLEKVGRAGDNDQLRRTHHSRLCFFVEFNDHIVVAPDDEKRRASDIR
jgi:hypothetical protein